MKVILLGIFSLVLTSNSKRILGIYSHIGKSHFNFGAIILRELAKRGHEVTMVSLYPLKQSIPNYTDVELDIFTEGLYDDVLWRWKRILTVTRVFMDKLTYLTNRILSQPRIQELPIRKTLRPHYTGRPLERRRTIF
ncbi:hypothetical protein JTB14_023606 [Gonioctena quinquepunctata]|nr:hypothetical protein JTB14_023606 [Gonioctena quinquepunctata]